MCTMSQMPTSLFCFSMRQASSQVTEPLVALSAEAELAVGAIGRQIVVFEVRRAHQNCRIALSQNHVLLNIHSCWVVDVVNCLVRMSWGRHVDRVNSCSCSQCVCIPRDHIRFYAS